MRPLFPYPAEPIREFLADGVGCVFLNKMDRMSDVHGIEVWQIPASPFYHRRSDECAWPAVEEKLGDR